LQALHLFSWGIVLGVNVLAFLVILSKADLGRLSSRLKPVRIDWILLIVIVIAFLHLYQVHFDYTGKYTVVTTPNYQEAGDMSYRYPYFADEWYSVAFVKYSIDFRSLPIVNPLASNQAFPNLEFPFHSFLSELFLLTGLEPLEFYTVLTILSGLLVIVLIYFLLRYYGVGKLVAAVASLSGLYITNGANLPGLWTLIPVVLGIIVLLLSFFFINSDKRMFVLSSILAFIFYPPLILFLLTGLLYAFRDDLARHKIKKILMFLVASVIVVGILSLSYFSMFGSLSQVVDYLFGKMFYQTFTLNFNPQFSIFSIVPIWAFLFAVFSVPFVFKKVKWLFYTVLLGLVYWLVYSMTSYRFLIEYPRVVVLTSVLIVLMSGFGLNRLVDYLGRKKIINYILFFVLLIFVFMSVSYTGRDNWMGLGVVNLNSGEEFAPAAPANRYLHEEDVRIFGSLEGKVFLSLPWKGTTIGVATGNYPIVTKPGTITMYKDLFSEFMRADCAGRREIVDSYGVDFVYIPGIDCEGFELVEGSSEGLGLYEVSINN